MSGGSNRRRALESRWDIIECAWQHARPILNSQCFSDKENFSLYKTTAAKGELLTKTNCIKVEMSAIPKGIKFKGEVIVPDTGGYLEKRARERGYYDEPTENIFDEIAEIDCPDGSKIIDEFKEREVNRILIPPNLGMVIHKTPRSAGNQQQTNFIRLVSSLVRYACNRGTKRLLQGCQYSFVTTTRTDKKGFTECFNNIWNAQEERVVFENLETYQADIAALFSNAKEAKKGSDQLRKTQLKRERANYIIFEAWSDLVER